MKTQEKHINYIIPVLQTMDTVDLRLKFGFTANKLHQIGNKRLIRQTDVFNNNISD